MAVNLVRRYQPDEARHLLNLSFAQYQADRDTVRLESRLERVDDRRDAALAQLHCDRGDLDGYLELVRELDAARASRPSRSRQIDEALSGLRPGGPSSGPTPVPASSSRPRPDAGPCSCGS